MYRNVPLVWLRIYYYIINIYNVLEHIEQTLYLMVHTVGYNGQLYRMSLQCEQLYSNWINSVNSV